MKLSEKIVNQISSSWLQALDSFHNFNDFEKEQWDLIEKKELNSIKIIDEMIKTLEFYANRNSWVLLENTSNMRSEISGDDLQEFRPNRKSEFCGGKRARECFVKIKNIMEGK